MSDPSQGQTRPADRVQARILEEPGRHHAALGQFQPFSVHQQVNLPPVRRVRVFCGDGPPLCPWEHTFDQLTDHGFEIDWREGDRGGHPPQVHLVGCSYMGPANRVTSVNQPGHNQELESE